MAWTYDDTALGTDTATGRLYSVRLLVGDTNTNDQQTSDESIVFALAQHNDNIYLAGSFVAGTLAAKYSRDVTFGLGNDAIAESASDLAKAYRALQRELRNQAQRSGSSTLGFASDVGSEGSTTEDRAFTMDQFDIEGDSNVSENYC